MGQMECHTELYERLVAADWSDRPSTTAPCCNDTEGCLRFRKLLKMYVRFAERVLRHASSQCTAAQRRVLRLLLAGLTAPRDRRMLRRMVAVLRPGVDPYDFPHRPDVHRVSPDDDAYARAVTIGCCGLCAQHTLMDCLD